MERLDGLSGELPEGGVPESARDPKPVELQIAAQGPFACLLVGAVVFIEVFIKGEVLLGFRCIAVVDEVISTIQSHLAGFVEVDFRGSAKLGVGGLSVDLMSVVVGTLIGAGGSDFDVEPGGC
jgi:hypothetical protein